MNRLDILRRAVAATAMVAISACSGGAGNINGTLPSVPGVNQPSHSTTDVHTARGKVTVRIHIPKKHKRVRIRVERHGKPKYVSAATQSMSIDISGPTTIDESVGLTPTSSGCSSSLTGTFCTLTVSGLEPGSYTASISTYDGPLNPSGGATGNLLSDAQGVGFTIVAGQNNAIGVTLDGQPVSVVLIPSVNSTIDGSMSSGFALARCGSDKVSVVGIDADDNFIVGPGAPNAALSSSGPQLIVASPAPAAPSAFTLTRPTSPTPAPGSTVQLTVSVTPANGGASSTISTTIPMTFDRELCGVFTEYSIPVAGGEPSGITVGSDGALWFAEPCAQEIGRITTGGSMTEINVGFDAKAVTSGPDGNVWYTTNNLDSSGNYIGDVTTGGTVGSAHYIGSISNGITSGPDGALWFTDGTHVIGRATTTGTVTEYTTPTAESFPWSITTGPDGALWFTECSDKIGRAAISPSGGAPTITEYPVGSQAIYMVNGPDNALWFAQQGRLGRITTTGSITQFGAGICDYSPIVTGPDGALWFANRCNDEVERMTTMGTITTAYPLPGANPIVEGMTLGPDDALWLTDLGDNVIIRMQ